MNTTVQLKNPNSDCLREAFDFQHKMDLNNCIPGRERRMLYVSGISIEERVVLLEEAGYIPSRRVRNGKGDCTCK